MCDTTAREDAGAGLLGGVPGSGIGVSLDPQHARIPRPPAEHRLALDERSKLCTSMASDSRLPADMLAVYNEVRARCAGARQADAPLKAGANFALCEHAMQSFVALMDQCSQVASEQGAMEAAVEMEGALHLIAEQKLDLKRLRDENEELFLREAAHKNELADTESAQHLIAEQKATLKRLRDENEELFLRETAHKKELVEMEARSERHRHFYNYMHTMKQGWKVEVGNDDTP